MERMIFGRCCVIIEKTISPVAVFVQKTFPKNKRRFANV